MRKRILLAISAMLILGLSIAVFAITKTNGALRANAAVSCCCKDGACPIKSKAGKDEDCCDMPDCCKKGDSCAMKKHDK